MQDRIMATDRVDNAQDTRLVSEGAKKIHVKFVYIDFCIYTTIVVHRTLLQAVRHVLVRRPFPGLIAVFACHSQIRISMS